jgi:hypothetical protein
MPKYQVVLSVVLYLLGLGPALAAQTDFAGRWEGSFKGTVFCVLNVQVAEGISGTLSPGRITGNMEGDITEAEPSPDGTFPLINPKIDGTTLRFEWKEDDRSETLKFEFKLTGKDEGELRVVKDQSMKPIRLRRQS